MALKIPLLNPKSMHSCLQEFAGPYFLCDATHAIDSVVWRAGQLEHGDGWDIDSVSQNQYLCNFSNLLIYLSMAYTSHHISTVTGHTLPLGQDKKIKLQHPQILPINDGDPDHSLRLT